MDLISSRARSRRLAVILLVWQICSALLPHVGKPSDARRRAHLHPDGASLEVVHDESACPSCAGVHLAGEVPTPARLLDAGTYEFQQLTSASERLPDLTQVSPASSRGPPPLA